jgi:hypothetical protein
MSTLEADTAGIDFDFTVIALSTVLVVPNLLKSFVYVYTYKAD